MRLRPLAVATFTLILMLSQAVGAASQGTPAATPSTDMLGIPMPGVDDLPREMDVIQDGERSLDDVVANFVDAAQAAERFEAWGWQANAVRGYHVPPGTALEAGEIDGIYISVHQFGDSVSAAEAMDFIAAAHVEGSELEDQEVNGLGDAAHEIYGEMPYGNEVTWYVQADALVIRFSASAPEGDPCGEGEPLLRAMLEG